MFSPYRGSNHGLLSSLSKSPREILATEKVAKTFEQPFHMLGNRRSRDMTKYCHFHEDHGHDTNDCRQLRHRIEESVKSQQLSHLVKGIKKEGKSLGHPTGTETLNFVIVRSNSPHNLLLRRTGERRDKKAQGSISGRHSGNPQLHRRRGKDNR
ncbi:hypothetical protein Tco_0417578 [Tanacetum coccineum]